MVRGGSANPEGMGAYSWKPGLFGGFRFRASSSDQIGVLGSPSSSVASA